MEATWPQGTRILLHLAFDGAAFAGWQVQPGQRTVQGEVEAALSRLLDRPVRVQASGRTDAGVHALHLPAHFDLPRPFQGRALHRGLNALLPEDCLCRRLEPVAPDFHARYDARGKLYRYRILNRPERPLFRRRRVLWEPRPLAVEAMAACLAPLVGRHDFASFCAADADTETTEREVVAARLLRRGDELHLEVAGSGFLKHMVRAIAGTALEVGLGRLPAEAMAAILSARDRSAAGPTARACGLWLVEVTYDPERLEAWRAHPGDE
ncbi:MAG: tRNA pseudouridine(38-40) synthase TruA [Nitrospirae bacterium]|nr:MAG: tRNA pseudouridine(38-40) synthase TruA [Nitrospirota bacterium]